MLALIFYKKMYTPSDCSNDCAKQVLERFLYFNYEA